MVFPGKGEAERARISCAGSLLHWGGNWLRSVIFPDTLENVEQVVVYDGFENYERGSRSRKGRAVVCGTIFGGLGAFVFCAVDAGHWMHVIMRGMDNVYLGG